MEGIVLASGKWWIDSWRLGSHASLPESGRSHARLARGAATRGSQAEWQQDSQDSQAQGVFQFSQAQEVFQFSQAQEGQEVFQFNKFNAFSKGCEATLQDQATQAFLQFKPWNSKSSCARKVCAEFQSESQAEAILQFKQES